MGASLRSALALLGKGPWLTRLRSDSGEDRWYSLFREGRGSGHRIRMDSFGSRRGDAGPMPGREACRIGGPRRGFVDGLAAPVEGAAFTAIAATGNIAVTAWEAGNSRIFPSAGIVTDPSADVLHRGRGAIQWSSDAPTRCLRGNCPGLAPARYLGRPRSAHGHKAFRRPRDGEPPRSQPRRSCHTLSQPERQLRLWRGHALDGRLEISFEPSADIYTTTPNTRATAQALPTDESFSSAFVLGLLLDAPVVYSFPAGKISRSASGPASASTSASLFSPPVLLMWIRHGSMAIFGQGPFHNALDPRPRRV